MILLISFFNFLFCFSIILSLDLNNLSITLTDSLDNLLRGDSKEKKQALKFLIKLGIGWIVGFLISATILSTLFNSKIYVLSSLFLGFIIFAIPVVIREEKDD